MAYAKGTATDFIDFVRKLRDFAAGVIDPAAHPDFTAGAAVPLAQRWAIQANGAGMPGLPAAGFASDGEVYLKGPGSDPLDEIVIGLKTYRNAGANVFGVRLRGFTQFNAGLAWGSLPGISPECFAAFDDALFQIWLYVNARRIMAVARIGTVDILIHCGFIQQFGTRAQYPYPLLIAGSVQTDTLSFQSNLFQHSCLPDPCGNGAHLRWVDGTWLTFENYNLGAGANRAERKSTGNVVWPHRNPTTQTEEGQSFTASEDSIFEGYALGGSLYISPSEIAAFPLFPTVLANSTALIGRVEGLYTTFGLGLVKGDTFDDGAKTYDIFGNTWRSEPIDFFAIPRE
jgi:hypothetical protein